MKQLALTLTFLGFLTASALASEEGSPSVVAQAFYNAYMRILSSHGDPEKWISKSDSLTPGFKTSYARLAKNGMESDPVVCGQDYPEAGFTASSESVTGNAATVTMKSRDPAFAQTIEVTLRKVAEGWLISGTNEIKEDPAGQGS